MIATLVERAKADRYGQEADTIRLFWRLAARFAGDMTMAFLATGGVTFSGGVLPHLVDFLDPAVFRARYEDKAPFGDLLRRVGTRILMVNDAIHYGLGAIAATPERYAIDYEGARLVRIKSRLTQGRSTGSDADALSSAAMLRLVARRLLHAVPTLLAVVTLSFFLMRLAPGGPFDSERGLDPVIRANLDHIYGLDRPLLVQFGAYLWALAHGDFGPSTHWRDFTVNELFAIALPISIALGSRAMALAVAVGVPLGLAGALRGRGHRHGARRALVDRGARRADPSSSRRCCRRSSGCDLHWLPVGGWEDGAWRHQVLPVFTLALPQIAIVAKLTSPPRCATRSALPTYAPCAPSACPAGTSRCTPCAARCCPCSPTSAPPPPPS